MRAASRTSSSRRLGPAVADVVEDGVVEQHRVLRHHAQRRAQRRLRDVADVLPVDGDAAAGHVVEAQQDARRPSTCRRPTGRRSPPSCRPAPRRTGRRGSAAPARSGTSRPRSGWCRPTTLSATAPGRSATSGLSASTSIMRSMSVSDCLISRYTMPMKLSGMNSCSISALTITKWPTVLLPGGDVEARHHHAERERDGEDRRPGRR